MVVYYVFDLDGTLTEQYSYYYFLADFKPRGVYKERGSTSADHENRITSFLSKDTNILLEKAYQEFVRLISVKESSEMPLGILRPGIVDVCREILQQQQAGLCGGALMYSNNPNKMVLEFVCDIIHEILGHPIFCTLADWNHPLRTSEITPSYPGMAKKTWNVLQKIIQKECGAPQVIPQQVMFFDDQHHPNLEEILPVDNYIHVTPYKFKPSIESIKQLYVQAIRSAGFNDKFMKSNLINYIRNVQTDFYTVKTPRIYSLSNHILRINKNSPHSATPGTMAPPPDNSSRKMLEEVVAFPEREERYTSRGGAHKTRRRTHRILKQHSNTRKR